MAGEPGGGGNRWSELRRAASLALEHRRRAKVGDLSVFLMPLAFAIAKDFIFDLIPIIGNIFGFFITVYLFIFMWGRGKTKLRIVSYILYLVDLIPVANLVPLDTLSVVMAYLNARKDAARAAQELAKDEVRLSREEQIARQREQIAAERQAREFAAKEAANDAAIEEEQKRVAEKE